MRKINNMSKAEEIDFLEGLVNDFSKSDTYLKSLFNQKLLTWFTGEVRNDTSCDIMGAMEWWIEQVNKAEKDSTELRNKLNSIERQYGLEIRVLREGLLDLVNQVQALEKEIQYKNAKIRELKELDMAGAVSIANCYPI